MGLSYVQTARLQASTLTSSRGTGPGVEGLAKIMQARHAGRIQETSATVIDDTYFPST